MATAVEQVHGPIGERGAAPDSGAATAFDSQSRTTIRQCSCRYNPSESGKAHGCPLFTRSCALLLRGGGHFTGHSIPGAGRCAGVTNSAGAMNDGAGLLLVEKLLHGVQFDAAEHERSQPDQGRFFDLAPTAETHFTGH